MTRYPHDFPWQIIACLAVTILCALGAVFSALCAVGRTLRDRRREDARPGFITDAFWPAGSDSWFEDDR